MPPTLLTLIDSAALRSLVESAAAGFEIREIPPLEDERAAVAFTADARPAAVLIEMDRTPPGWLGAVRSDPATRRVPLIALVTEAEGEAQARKYHAEATFAWGTLTQDALREIIHEYLRSAPDAAVLSNQCSELPPPLVLRGLREFNAGDYFECHETLEEAWMHETGPVRELYRAILQVGVAYFQITRANYRGAHKMFLRAVQWITPLPDYCQGIDVARLKQDAMAARVHLESLGEAHIGDFDKRLLKPIIYEAATDDGKPPV